MRAEAKKLIGKKSNPTHQQINGLKLHRVRPCPPEQDLVFPTTSLSHQEAYRLASSIRGQAEGRRTTIQQWLKPKPYHRKLISMKKQKVTSQMKGQDKTPEKQLNEVEIGNLPKKEVRIVIV